MRRTLLVIGALIAMTLSMCVVHPLVPINASLAQSSVVSNAAVSVLGKPSVGTPTPATTSQVGNQAQSSFDWQDFLLKLLLGSGGLVGLVGLIVVVITGKYNNREKREAKIDTYFETKYPRKLKEILSINIEEGYPALRVRTTNKLPDSFPVACDGDGWIRAEQRELSGRIRGGETEELLAIIKRRTNEKRWMIIGSFGVGKTVCLKTIALRVRSIMGVLEPDLKPEVSLFSSETLPIFVELEDFVKFFLHKWVFPSNMIAFVVRLLPKWIGRRYKAKNPLLDYVAERLVKTYEFPCRKAFAYDYLKKKLSGESLLLLLDGLDKALTSQSPKKMQEVGNRVVAVIKDLSSENSPIIVTAHECVDSRLLGFQYLWVENLTQRDRHTFVENWGRVENHPDIAIQANVLFGRTLYLQALVTSVHATSHVLTMYNRKSSRPDYSIQDWAKFCNDYSKDLLTECNVSKEERGLLERIAWDLHKAGLHSNKKETILLNIASPVAQINLNWILRLKKRFETLLPKFHRRLSDSELFGVLLLKHGLLRESAEISEQYGLLSHPLQEHFAAMYVVNYKDNAHRDTGENPLEVLKNNRHNPRWEDVISLYVQYAPELEVTFLEELMDLNIPPAPWSPPSDFKSYMTHILVVLRLMANVDYQGLPDLRNKIILCLYGVLLHPAPPFIHELIALTFFDVGQQIDEDALESLLRSPAAQNSYFPFIQKLQDARDLLSPGTMLSPLFLYLLSNAPHEIQEKLIEFVTMDGNSVKENLLKPGMNDELLKRLKPGMNDEIRRRMIATILTQDKRFCAKILSELVADPKMSKGVRIMMAHALSVLAGNELIDVIFARLDDTSIDVHVRWNLIKTLGVLGSRGIDIPDHPVESSIARKLLQRLEHENKHYINDQYLRWHVAFVLIKILGYESGSEKQKVLDRIPDNKFSEPVKSGIRILRVKKDREAEAIKTLLKKARFMRQRRRRAEKCIEISEIVGYLTADEDDVEELKKIWLQMYRSPLPPKQVYESSLPPPELKECMMYVEWIVGRRAASRQI